MCWCHCVNNLLPAFPPHQGYSHASITLNRLSLMQREEEREGNGKTEGEVKMQTLEKQPYVCILNQPAFTPCC